MRDHIQPELSKKTGWLSIIINNNNNTFVQRHRAVASEALAEQVS